MGVRQREVISYLVVGQMGFSYQITRAVLVFKTDQGRVFTGGGGRRGLGEGIGTWFSLEMDESLSTSN